MKSYLVLACIFISISSVAQTWHRMLKEENLSNSTVTCIASDINQNVWIGTTNGVYKYNNNGLTYLNTSDGLISNNVSAISCELNGKVWIGSPAGLTLLQNGITSTFNIQDGMQSQNVKALAIGENNVLWIGTNSGVIKFNGNSFTQYTTTNGLASNSVKNLAYDGINLWIGTVDGLSKYNGASFENYFTTSGLPNNNINALYSNSINDVWIGTSNGVAHNSNSGFTLLNSSNGLLSNIVNSITSDINGNMWFLGDNVIMRMQGNVITGFNADFYFPSSILKCIYSYNNDVYIGTNEDCIKTKIWCAKNIKNTEISTGSVSSYLTNLGGVLSNETNIYASNGLEFPALSGKHTISWSNLWIAGLDPQQNIHSSTKQYPQHEELFSGPFSGSSNVTDSYDSLYNRLWVVSADEISNHISQWNQPGYQMIEVIKNWPSESAPFADLNNNSLYEPELGEYPQIRGDKSVLCIYNDNRFPHSSGGEKLKAEVVLLYWVYIDTTNTALSNTVFVNVHVTNHHNEIYNDVYLGVFADIDIGNPTDDYSGCDSTLNCFFGYNKNSSDNTYGSNVPAQGVVFLSSPMRSFQYFYIQQYPVIDPSTPVEYYNVLRGFWADGSAYTYGGNGFGGVIPTKYIFSGDPVTGSGWSEVSENNSAGDRRALGTIGPFTLLPGKAICLDFAYVTGLDSAGNNLTSVNVMKDNIREVIQFYNTNSYYCDTISLNIPTDLQVFTEDIHSCKNTNCGLSPQVSGYYPPFSYTWQPTTGLSNPNVANPTVNINISTTYYLTVTDAHGNTVTDSMHVTIENPTVNPSANYDLCSGEYISLPSGYTYEWSHNYSMNFYNNFYNSGTYWVRVKDQTGCWSDTSYFNVDISESPLVDLGSNVELCNDGSLTLYAGGPFSSYLWNNGTTNDSVNIIGSTLDIANYIYSVTVTNNTGCPGIDEIVVKVIDCMSSSFVENDLKFSAFPIPFDDYITIDYDGNENYTIKIINANGKEVVSYSNVPRFAKLSTEYLSSGFYTLKYYTKSSTGNIKIIKL